MTDIKLKGQNGEETVYENVDSIAVPKTDGDIAMYLESGGY